MKKSYWDFVWSKTLSFPNKNNTKELPWETYKHDTNLEKIINKLNIDNYDVLELGCGSGHDTLFLSKLAKSVTSIDISETAIKVSKETNADRKNVEFIIGNIDTDLPNKQYDLVYDKGCLHNNMKVASSYFQNLYSRLKDGGKIILITGNSNNRGSLYTTPSLVDISSIEQASSGIFKIKYVKEIAYELNKNYEDCLGWIFILEKI